MCLIPLIIKGIRHTLTLILVNFSLWWGVGVVTGQASGMLGPRRTKGKLKVMCVVGVWSMAVLLEQLMEYHKVMNKLCYLSPCADLLLVRWLACGLRSCPGWTSPSSSSPSLGLARTFMRRLCEKWQ